MGVGRISNPPYTLIGAPRVSRWPAKLASALSFARAAPLPGAASRRGGSLAGKESSEVSSTISGCWRDSWWRPPGSASGSSAFDRSTCWFAMTIPPARSIARCVTACGNMTMQKQCHGRGFLEPRSDKLPACQLEGEAHKLAACGYAWQQAAETKKGQPPAHRREIQFPSGLS
jgi:hypothetical protein